MPTKIILDVDTGTDDAVALMTAVLHPEIELVAACSVNGNQTIEKTTENTLRVMGFLNRPDIPVYRGCELPMVSTLNPDRKPNVPYTKKSDVHGDYLPIPKAMIDVQPQHAVNYLIDTYMATTEEIILVSVGPLTNLGMALRLEPRLAERIPQVVIMGGGHMIGNITPSAEWNIYVDPEAARIVMQSGIPVTLVPLDATHAAYTTYDEAIAIQNIGSPYAKAAASFMLERIEGYKIFDKQMGALNATPVHDALCIAAILDPDILEEVVECFVDIDCDGELTDGRTVCDVNFRTGNPPNAKLALSANREKFNQFLFETLSLMP